MFLCVWISCIPRCWLEWAQFRTWSSKFMLMLLKHPWPQMYRNDVRGSRVYDFGQGNSLLPPSPLFTRVIGIKSWNTEILTVCLQGNLLNLRNRQPLNYKKCFDSLFQVSLWYLLDFLFSAPSCLVTTSGSGCENYLFLNLLWTGGQSWRSSIYQFPITVTCSLLRYDLTVLQLKKQKRSSIVIKWVEQS